MNPSFHSHFYHQVSWKDLDQKANQSLVSRALQEDLEGLGFSAERIHGDATSELFLSYSQNARAKIVAREHVTVAGIPLIPSILKEVDEGLQCEELVEDGTQVPSGGTLARISGPASSLFTVERTLLNFIQMLSGIATTTSSYVSALGNSSTRLLDTRKTPPGYRALCKYAVAAGGGWNHRLGLYDRVMIKDNHLATLGGAAEFLQAVKASRKKRPDLPIEVEIDHLNQLPKVLRAEPDVILLDNFNKDELSEAVATIGRAALTEASGNIMLESLPALADLGLDFISTGATVHRSRWVDVGLDIESWS
ncbi:MAG: carboxylating nicotinate-nucleotide diphosphorylase [Verrucomicrobiota bacterium]